MKRFNTTAICIPSKHYMVDITDKVMEIKKLVDAGKYFSINRARQYGKTTTVSALSQSLSEQYTVLLLDFQKISNACFSTEEKFVQEFCRSVWSRRKVSKGLSEKLLNKMKESTMTYLLINGEKVYFAGRIVIGRSRDCDVLLNNSTVSRHHALIEQSGSFFLLHDLHSKNKTLLNRHPVSPNRYVSLNSGDSIRLGDVTLYFMQESD